jgi:hypothetical protein
MPNAFELFLESGGFEVLITFKHFFERKWGTMAKAVMGELEIYAF